MPRKEYARDENTGGAYDGLFAVLLCRVVVGSSYVLQLQEFLGHLYDADCLVVLRQVHFRLWRSLETTQKLGLFARTLSVGLLLSNHLTVSCTAQTVSGKVYVW